MSEDSKQEQISRRGMLGITSAAMAAAGAVAASGDAAAAPQDASAAEYKRAQGVTSMAPKNEPMLQENRDSFYPPETDHSDEAAFKYPFSLAHNRRQDGGWGRQVTVRDFPISKELAGVNMRLTPGGIRELHWHLPAEWAYMLEGTARITAVDAAGKSFVQDVKKGDLWYFAAGVPHSIQGLNPSGCEFLLVFDDGAFSEFDTFLISDWVAHTPMEVLAKNFGAPASAFSEIPKKELWIFQGTVPGPLAADQQAAAGMPGNFTEPLSYALTDHPPTKSTKSGEVWIADSNNFKASKTIAAALVKVRPGGLREMHWHPNADEWQYYISGNARMTVFASSGRARTMDFQPADVGYIPRSMGHYIENTGDTDLVFLEIFRSSFYQDISLTDWVAHTPPALITEHLHLDEATWKAISKTKMTIVPG